MLPLFAQFNLHCKAQAPLKLRHLKSYGNDYQEVGEIIPFIHLPLKDKLITALVLFM